jgi:hypothetical protein
VVGQIEHQEPRRWIAHAIGKGLDFLGAIQPVSGIIDWPLARRGERFGDGSLFGNAGNA